MPKFKLQRKKTFVIIILGLFIVVCVLVALLSMNRNIFAFALSVGEYEDSSVINENEFSDNSIILVLDEKISGINKKHNYDYFKGIDIKKIVDLTERKINKSNDLIDFRQILQIYLKNDTKEEVLRAVSKLEQIEGVMSAEPNYSVKPTMVPNDDLFNDQWNLHDFYGINATQAWNISRGTKKIRVGIIDSGIENNIDLERNLSEGYDFYNNNTITTDVILDHGTNVAGIIGAVGNNKIGVTGINWEVTLIPLQVSCLDQDNKIYFYLPSIIKAINWATDLWGTDQQIDILNYSGGIFGEDKSICSAVAEYPGLFVWAAGNDGKNVDSFKDIDTFNLDNLISVGAVDKYNERSVWSSTGSSNYGSNVNIFAPGGGGGYQNIITTSTDTSFTYMFNGTSAAAPHVTGVAALLLSVDPNLSARALKNLILEGASTITITLPDNTTQTVKMLDAYNPLTILEANKNKTYRVRFDKSHYIELIPKLIHEQDFTYSQTHSVTAPETMTYTDSNDHRDIRIFTAWRMNLNGTDGYDKDKNPWIQLSTDRTFTLNLSDIVNAYYPYFNENDTIYIRAAFSENVSRPPSQSCIAENSLITLADGSQKAVQDLTGDEMLLVWNMFTGTFDTAPILCIDSDPENWYEVIKLCFSDGTEVEVISEHGFWDYDLNEYVYLGNNAEDYIGHWFNKQTADSGGFNRAKVQLTEVSITQEYTTAWSPVTYSHLCYYVNGMLTMPGGIAGLFNIFETDGETMKYDEVLYQQDIKTYGLYTYEEFAEILPVSEELFEAVNGQYLKVAIGKGLIDEDTLSKYIERYLVLFE